MRTSIQILLIDNLDSFTFNICEYLRILGCEVKVIRLEALNPSDFIGIHGVVISPGPGNPITNAKLIETVNYAINRFPVLGICLGFQAIALVFGSKVVRGNPMHGKISKVRKLSFGKLTKDLPVEFEVVRYHSLLVTELKFPLVPLLGTKTGELMAFEHNTMPIAGIQYHPEAHLTQYGFEILKNWLSLC